MDVLQGEHLWMEDLLAGVDAQPNTEAEPTAADRVAAAAVQEVGAAI